MQILYAGRALEHFGMVWAVFFLQRHQLLLRQHELFEQRGEQAVGEGGRDGLRQAFRAKLLLELLQALQ